MHFGPALSTQPITLRIEHCDIRVIDGNWGVFHQSFSGHVHGYHELHLVTGGSGRLNLRGADIRSDRDQAIRIGCPITPARQIPPQAPAAR